MHDFENALLFRRIIKEGSLTKAANKLEINASAVSKRLSKLEASLGTQLIKRTTRKLVLTEAGRYFYEKINRLEKEWQTTINETSSYGKQIKGKLVIAAPQPLASRFLLPVIAKFQQHYPTIDLEIVHQQMEQLPSMDADISISRELERYDSHTMLVRSFFHYQNSLFASPTYLTNHPVIQNLEDLKHHSCLCYESTSHWHFSKQSIKLEQVIMTNNAEIMINAAKQGMGLAYLPKAIISEELEQGTLIPVLQQYQSKQFNTCAYYVKADFMPQKIRAFIDFLCEYFSYQYNG